MKFSFAFGGKDGVPYPVDRKAMDESIQILKQSVQEAKIGENEKLHSLVKAKTLCSRKRRCLTLIASIAFS